MEYWQFRDKNETIVYSDFPDDFIFPPSEIIQGKFKFNKVYHVGYFSGPEGVIVVAVKIDKGGLSKNKFQVYLKSSYISFCKSLKYRETLKKNLDNKGRHFTHNVADLLTTALFEFYAYIDQTTLEKSNAKTIRDIFKDKIKTSPVEGGKVLSRIYKSLNQMKIEINTFRYLETNTYKAKYREHNIKKVFLNMYHLFFHEFIEKDLRLVIDENDLMVKTDYDIISIVFYHLIHNATKYCKRDSEVKVSFVHKENYLEIKISVDSAMISHPKRIFEEGFKEDVASILSPESNGLGLFQVKNLLQIIDSKIVVDSGVECTSIKGIDYSSNSFVLSIFSK